MKLLCWNIRGFGLTGRRRQLIEYMRQEEIDIVGLHETIRQDLSMLELQRLSHHQFASQWLPAAGHSAGILIGVREDTFSVEDFLAELKNKVETCTTLVVVAGDFL
ncbi:hypothetical protein D1007_16304 [Hordeum vulgare]|uniref:Endonuclease/exonuclease/phosphatase domain-containing protein n=1 Tax=Hordeum vulgare subsp. vulgare TaxID=112509 RepID=A0A8I6Y6P7_HORVV|nr:hypothetical protein D1007_16304 [Hordeum vulgare]